MTLLYKTLTPEIKALILDLDGVLWRSEQPIGDLKRTFSRINNLGLKYVFATNNGTRDPQTVIDRLTGYGIPCEPWQLVQSSMATVFLLQKQFPQGGPVYIIGEIGLINTLAKSGFYYSEKDPLAVVVSMDREINYTKIAKAMNFIRSGKPFFATNPDRTFPTPEGLIPGGGAIIAAVQACSEVAPVIAGKPYAPIYQLALDRLKTQPKETLAIGDRLDTDILGGNNARLRTAFVLTGVNTPNDLENFIPKPDLVATDLSALFEES